MERSQRYQEADIRLDYGFSTPENTLLSLRSVLVPFLEKVGKT
jgi:hypothetical protein